GRGRTHLIGLSPLVTDLELFPTITMHGHVSYGDLPGSMIANLAGKHPFTQQLDVIFPADDTLAAALSVLEATFMEGSMELSSLAEKIESFVVVNDQWSSEFSALSVDPHTDDTWCIDTRGLLTLYLSDESYQQLGLTGKKVPFKNHLEHVVSLPLQPGATSEQTRRKRDGMLRAWDDRRKREGLEPWSVLLNSAPTQISGAPTLTQKIARCNITTTRNIRAPQVSLRARPKDPEPGEDWDEEMHMLLEWIGMAGLGAQRLAANDQVDPFVSLYEVPAPSQVADLTRLRWTGFLSPTFVRSLLEVVETSVKPDFVCVTANMFTRTPVSYLSPDKPSPMRVPDQDGEDTWVLIFAGTKWCLAESIGRQDTRWG
ncbi:unnamed protein product, partial [Mycena citricolor]